MKKIALTGASSMLGVALAEECLCQNTEVVALVRDGSANNLRISSLPNVTMLPCSLSQLETFEHPATRGCEVFYHFAWYGTGRAERMDALVQNQNISWTLAALKLAAKIGCGCFVGAGSQAEYGRMQGRISPLAAVAPDSAYGIAKYAAGRLSLLQAEKLNIRGIWGRVFSVYGPYDHDDTLVMYCLKSLLRGEAPQLTKCEQKWDYLYSKDAARAFYKLGEHGKAGGQYNIGSGQAIPLLERVLLMQKYANPNLMPLIGAKPYAENQVMHLCADIDSLCQDTGFSPSISFDMGMEQMVAWLQETM